MKEWRVALITAAVDDVGCDCGEVIEFDRYADAMARAREDARSGAFVTVEVVDVFGRIVWAGSTMTMASYDDRAGLAEGEGFYLYSSESGWRQLEGNRTLR